MNSIDYGFVNRIDFDKSPDGLVPVVVQNQVTGEILTVAYANREAVEKTLKTGFAHFYSRSRASLWKKGETSGHLQEVNAVIPDCDNDALIYFVSKQHGPACHTGANSCFTNTVLPSTASTWLNELENIIDSRVQTDAPGSYVAELHQRGLPKIAQKVGEEAVETVIAALAQDRRAFVGESADLIFHLLVLLGAKKCSLSDVVKELKERHAKKDNRK